MDANGINSEGPAEEEPLYSPTDATQLPETLAQSDADSHKNNSADETATVAAVNLEGRSRPLGLPREGEAANRGRVVRMVTQPALLKRTDASSEDAEGSDVGAPLNRRKSLSDVQKAEHKQQRRRAVETPKDGKPARDVSQRNPSDFDIFGEPEEESTDDTNSLDSYGIPAYAPRYTEQTGRVTAPLDRHLNANDLSVPWNMRKPMHKRINCAFFDFLREPQFWKLFEFATRITAIAVLVPSAIIAADVKHNPFVSAFMVFSSTVLAAKGSVGEAIAYLFVWIRAGCLWLPLAVVAGALHLGNHVAGWCVYYTGILFVMAVFTEAMPRRICLLLFNSCVVGLLVSPSRGAVYPCRVMGDWCIGTGLCTAAAFIPYPIFCKKEAQQLLSDIAKNTGTAFSGLVYSFWSPSNVERNMAMSKVRIMTESLDVLLPSFEHSQAFSFFEFFFESAEVRELRALKFHLFERLRVNLSSMTRVLDMVEATPNAIDGSDRSQAFGQLLMPHLNTVAEAFDELMDMLAAAKTKKAVLALAPNFDNMRHRTDEMQDAYLLARRMLFYEHTSATLEEFVPLMTFYLFTVICFRDTIDIFEMKAKGFHADIRSTAKGIVMKTAVTPFMDNMDFLNKLFTKHNRREVQRVFEAAKVSGAMILTIGFSYLIDVEKSSFSGPNIIAFVSGMNPVEAVQASIVRLTGCLIGTVLGFFAGTYSVTPVQRVASLCTLMFCGTFLRTDKEYGIMSVYAMFVLIPLDSVLKTTMEDTVARMNQNTFGIFIYLFVSILVLPLSPSFILRMKRINVLKHMSTLLTHMLLLFAIPLVRDLGTHPFTFADMRSHAVAVLPRDEDDSDVELADVNGVQNKVSNRSIHMVLRTDTPMQLLSGELDELIKRLRGTKEFMGFAKDERGLVTIDYPVKACQATYLHMYRMTFLLKTMWLSWNVIRGQRSYTQETQHMMRNLQPVAHDVAASFEKIVDLMSYMMRDPSVNLEGEVTKAELDLITASSELNTRKSQIMLMLINSSVEQFRENLAAETDNNATVDFGPNPLMQSAETAAEDSAVAPGEGVFSAQARRPHSSLHHPFEVVLSSPTRPVDGSFFLQTQPGHGSRHRLPRAATFDGTNLSGAGGRMSPSGSPNVQQPHRGFNVIASERNVSVLPYLHNQHNKGSGESHVSDGPVRLPDNFQFPVTSEDAEGLHSFGLCLEMFSNETKLLTMSLGVMLDHLRSKL